MLTTKTVPLISQERKVSILSPGFGEGCCSSTTIKKIIMDILADAGISGTFPVLVLLDEKPAITDKTASGCV